MNVTSKQKVKLNLEHELTLARKAQFHNKAFLFNNTTLKAKVVLQLHKPAGGKNVTLRRQKGKFKFVSILR